MAWQVHSVEIDLKPGGHATLEVHWETSTIWVDEGAERYGESAGDAFSGASADQVERENARRRRERTAHAQSQVRLAWTPRRVVTIPSQPPLRWQLLASPPPRASPPVAVARPAPRALPLTRAIACVASPSSSFLLPLPPPPPPSPPPSPPPPHPHPPTHLLPTPPHPSPSHPSPPAPPPQGMTRASMRDNLDDMDKEAGQLMRSLDEVEARRTRTSMAELDEKLEEELELERSIQKEIEEVRRAPCGRPRAACRVQRRSAAIEHHRTCRAFHQHTHLLSPSNAHALLPSPPPSRCLSLSLSVRAPGLAGVAPAGVGGVAA